MMSREEIKDHHMETYTGFPIKENAFPLRCPGYLMRKRECIYQTSKKLDEELLAMNKYVQRGRSRSDLLNQLSTSRTIERPISFRDPSDTRINDENIQEVIVSNPGQQMKLIIRGAYNPQSKF